MDNTSTINKFSVLNSLQKSVSTVDLNMGFQNLKLRETKSLTENNDNIKIVPEETNNNYQVENNKESIFHTTQTVEKGYETREVHSNQVYVVSDEMLTYRGKRYSFNDIATQWKKDCRMWLWKSNKHRKNRSLGELREKLQTLKILN